jgi:drug/metabolite transporter (DMT)-like permease
MKSPVAATQAKPGTEDSVRVRLGLLAMVMFFGGSLPAYKWATLSFGPATTNLIRFVIAAAVLGFVARKRLHTVDTTARKRLLLIGVFGLGLMAVFMSIGVQRGSATVASIVVGLEPIGVALAGVLLVGDKPSTSSWVALGVGFTGAIVAAGVFTQTTGPSPMLPMLLLLGTVITFSIYTANVRRTSRGVDPLAVAAITQLGALIFVVPALLFDIADGGITRGTGIQGKAIGAAVFLGLGSALAYLLLCLVLIHAPPSRVAVSMFLTPMFGVLFSWLIIGEHLHLRHAVGAALVLAALWIIERAPAPPRPA